MLPSVETSLPTLPVPLIQPGLPDADPQSLNRAFEWFSDAAASLERSYSQLKGEVSRLREELSRKQDELDQEREAARNAKALADVSAALAHEIRNPLAGMELFTDLLLECKELGNEPRNWASQIQAGLRALAATVNNVLQMHASTSTSYAAVNIGDVLDATVQFVSPIAEQTGIAILLEDGTDQTRVAGDPHRLQQVFLNLAMNAFRAMPEGGSLRISAQTLCRRRKKMLEIRFEDEGTGIAPGDLAKIFEPGFTTRPGSVGLGLAVSRKIVEQHGGSICVDTTSTEGTAFSLRFPSL